MKSNAFLSAGMGIFFGLVCFVLLRLLGMEDALLISLMSGLLFGILLFVFLLVYGKITARKPVESEKEKTLPISDKTYDNSHPGNRKKASVKQEYVYEYPHTKEQLIAALKNSSGMIHNWSHGDYLIKMENENHFSLGVQRGGHSGGYWYIARIEESETGMPIIRGNIVRNPDSNGNPRQETVKEKMELVLLTVLLLPLVIVVKSIQFIRMLLQIIRKKPIPRPAEEVKLDRFMIEYLCCSKR